MPNSFLDTFVLTPPVQRNHRGVPFLLRVYHFVLALVVISCSTNHTSDPCCTYDAIKPGTFSADGQGILQVEGSTSTKFHVLDQNGSQVGSQSLNSMLALDAGAYTVRVNNSYHRIEIREDERVTCSTGTIMITGNSTDYYHVIDSTYAELGYEILGKPMSYFPGRYRVRVNNTESDATVRIRQLTELRSGAVLVRGTTRESYYVLDKDNRQLASNALEQPLSFLPGTYTIKVNNTSRQAAVIAGNVTQLQTGNVLVHGLTAEYYYVTDSAGHALNFQILNKPLALFPGHYTIQVNNTQAEGKVLPDETIELLTGSLALTGSGTGYYYVLDASGNTLNSNVLNKALSFFPSDYIVKVGSSQRKATVAAGQFTPINAFQ